MLNIKSFASYPIACTTRDSAVSAVITSATKGRPDTFRFVNAGTVDAAARSDSYRSLLRGQGVNFADGKPLSALLERTSPQGVRCEQIRGPWLFEEVLNVGRATGMRHFLFGTTPKTLQALQKNAEAMFPGVKIVGTQAPPFRIRTLQEIEASNRLIADSKAQIVWVALGTPKQDAEALRILNDIGITTVAVGAAFDFTAGTKRSAPAVIQRAGFEWLFRLCSEPRRLWRRYLVGNLRFMYLSCVHILREDGTTRERDKRSGA